MTIPIKSIHTNPKHPSTPRPLPFLHTFQILKKSIPTNLKISDTIFCSSLFQILKKAYLQIWKNLEEVFCSSLFQILKKAYLRIWKNLEEFFCSSLFQILEKHTYEYWNFWHNFLLIAFSNTKESILTNLKKPGRVF